MTQGGLVDAGRPSLAVNLLWCVPGQVGGSEEYLVRQLLGFAQCAGGVDVAGIGEPLPTLYCRRDFVDAHPELARRFPTVVAPTAGDSRAVRVALEHTWLAARNRHHDLVHHGGGTKPRWGGRRTVVTLHDLQWRQYPEYVNAAKLRYLRLAVPPSLRAATVVTTPTEYVKGTVVDAFDIDPERIVVVPHGVEPGLGANAPDPDVLRADYALGDGPVLVYPAITHPHKGHRFLLELLRTRWTDPALRLVLLGGRGRGDDAVRRQLDRSPDLAKRVVRPGRVTSAHRDGLVRLADALVFPSEYEGFGAPVVEAMALGTPVIASDQPALVEVAGGAALHAPLDLDAWAPLLEEVRGRRSELVAAGSRRSERFTAARSGAALADAYAQALGSAQPVSTTVTEEGR